MTHFVIIGGGQAGIALAAKLRSEKFEGDITVVGAEPTAPYQRPPLSKAYLLGEMPLERLLLRGDDWYKENNVTLLLDRTVTDIDSSTRSITAGDKTIPYDELALCTGSTPRRLPSAIGGELNGVYTVRDLSDADAMAPEFVSGRKLLVVGGGYIGLEAAAVAAKKGVDVTLIEMAPRILQRVACQQTSDYFRDLHNSHGVKILENTGLARLIGDDHVTGAELTNGQIIDVDFVIVGVGITPEDKLAKMAGATCSNGIDTDSFGRTTVSHIWAAGDCANSTMNGERLRLESVGNAIDQAEIVARNMLGGQIEYQPKPWFWSDQYDTKLQIAGLNTGYDAVHVKSNPDVPGFRVHWYFSGDQLIAVDAMNAPRDYMVGKRLIEAKKSPLPEQLTDPDGDLKSLLRA